MRYGVLWLVLFGLYAGTLGIDAFGMSDYGGAETHYLTAAESLVSDGDLDLSDEHAARAWSDFYPYALEFQGRRIAGRMREPHGIGFALLIAPAYALAGPRGVELFLAAVAALGFAVALRLARIVVPEPWATRGVALTGVSLPAVAYGATVYPELAAGALLAVAVAFAVRARADARVPDVAASALALALLPWLGAEYLAAALPVGGLLLHWTLRQHRGLAALIALELLTGSLIAYTSVNQALYGSPISSLADVEGVARSGPEFPGGYVERLPRLAALWLDRDYGIARWAPVLVLALLGVWLLWRSRRDLISHALPARREAEAVASLAAGACAGQLAMAVLAAPTMFGFWFPGRHLVAALPLAAVLVAWALRHAPRIGAALGALTMLATAWLLVELRTGAVDGWVPPASSAPWGPLERLLPAYGVGSVWADALGLTLAAGLLALVAAEWRAVHNRRPRRDAATRA